ncbi:MAG: FHA domain-containing protein [Deltaproteobacteria bacterium]|nr:FHA domain-containing protein [Deltaproteobacteria bacterium]
MSESSSSLKREALPQDLEAYKREAQRVSKQAFAQQRPHPFLLYARSTLWDRTLLLARAAGAGAGRGTQLVSYDIPVGGLSFLSPIRKRQSEGDPSVILLGRSTDNDVIVPVPSVSSRHATFTLDAQRNTWTVTDLGSTNGTFFGEERMTPQKPYDLRDGSYLRLGGNLIAWFFAPGRMWEVLLDTAQLNKLID